jgi:hypothetical protein
MRIRMRIITIVNITLLQCREYVEVQLILYLYTSVHKQTTRKQRLQTLIT